MNITLTSAAGRFIDRMVRFGGGGGFRLSVSPGGCSGLSSEFTVEAAPRAGDAVFESGGVKLFLPAESRILLEGVTIDFRDTPTETGLAFIDPKAPACACATSSSEVAAVSVASIQRRS